MKTVSQQPEQKPKQPDKLRQLVQKLSWKSVGMFITKKVIWELLKWLFAFLPPGPWS